MEHVAGPLGVTALPFGYPIVIVCWLQLRLNPFDSQQEQEDGFSSKIIKIGSRG